MRKFLLVILFPFKLLNILTAKPVSYLWYAGVILFFGCRAMLYTSSFWSFFGQCLLGWIVVCLAFTLIPTIAELTEGFSTKWVRLYKTSDDDYRMKKKYTVKYFYKQDLKYGNESRSLD